MKNNQITAFFDKSLSYMENKDYNTGITSFRKTIEKIDKWLEKNLSSNEDGDYLGLKAHSLACIARGYKMILEAEAEKQTAFEALNIIDSNDSIPNDQKARVIATIAFLENPNFPSIELYNKAFNLAEDNRLKATIKKSQAQFVFDTTGDAKKAISIIQNLIEQPEIDDLKCDILSDISYYYTRVNDLTNAEKYLKIALTSNPTQQQKEAIYYDLSLIYTDMHKYQKSIELSEELLKTVKDKKLIAQIYNNLIVAQNKMENFETAVKLFDKAIEFAKNENEIASGLYMNLSYAYFFSKEYDKAFDACSKGLELTNDKDTRIAFYINMASIYANKGETNNAIKMVDNALLCYPGKLERAQLLTTAGNIRATESNYEIAQANFQKALDVLKDTDEPFQWFIKTALVELHVDMYYDWVLNVPNNDLIDRLRKNTIEEIEEIKQNFDKLSALNPQDAKYIEQTIERCESLLNKNDKLSLSEMTKMLKDNQFEQYLKANNIEILSNEDIENIKMWTILPISNLVKKGKEAEQTTNFSSGLNYFNRMLEFYTTGIFWKFLKFSENKYRNEKKFEKVRQIKEQKINIQNNKFGLADFCKGITPYDKYGTRQADKDFIEFLKTLPFGQNKTDYELEQSVLEFEDKVDICRKSRNNSSHLNIDTKSGDKIEPRNSNKISMSNFLAISNLVLFQKNSIVKDIENMFGDFFEKNQTLKSSKKQTTLNDFIK